MNGTDRPLSVNLTSSLVDGGPVHVLVCVFSSLCRYYNVTERRWSSEGLRPLGGSTLHEAHCLTRHLTIFGASLFVHPGAVVLLPPVFGKQCILICINVFQYFTYIKSLPKCKEDSHQQALPLLPQSVLVICSRPVLCLTWWWRLCASSCCWFTCWWDSLAISWTTWTAWGWARCLCVAAQACTTTECWSRRAGGEEQVSKTRQDDKLKSEDVNVILKCLTAYAATLTHQAPQPMLASVCMVWTRAGPTICTEMELFSEAAWTSFTWRLMTAWEKFGKSTSGTITQVQETTKKVFIMLNFKVFLNKNQPFYQKCRVMANKTQCSRS